MSDIQPYVIPVVQGATLFREISILDSDRVPVDVTNAAKSIQVADGIAEGDFIVQQGTEGHLVEIRADGADTTTWPVGSFRFRVWLDWGESADVEDEPIFSGVIAVEAKL